MKRLIEYLLIILISFSVIEFATIVLAMFLYSGAGYTNLEALNSSRIIVIELFICIIASFVYNKIIKDKKKKGR